MRPHCTCEGDPWDRCNYCESLFEEEERESALADKADDERDDLYLEGEL